MRYKVADPNSYLVITGVGIEACRIAKRAFVLPLQKVTTISITPFDLSMNLHVMTSEKLTLVLPAVFTIGPHDDPKSVTRYATLLTGESDGMPIATKGTVATGRNHVMAICRGIVEGEMRSIVSTMTMEELFRERKVFKDSVIKNVQSELDQFGLIIYNANVKELQDTPGNEYFSSLSRKAHEGAINQARVDTAEQRAKGEVGEAEKQGDAKQKIAIINANTAVAETERKVEKAAADAKLKTKEINIERALEIERIEARRAAESKSVELQKSVELKRAEMELERLRATEVTQAQIAKESAAQKAQADLFKKQKEADGRKYAVQAEAEAEFLKRERETNAVVYRQTAEAKANLEARTMEAEAAFKSKKAEADGIREMAAAYCELGAALGGPAGLMQYLMIKEGTYEKLALANAKAVNGLQPKITVWNTGSGAGAGEGQGDASGAAIRNIFQALPPLFGTIHEQTGQKPPGWLWNMGEQDGQGQGQGQMVNGHGGEVAKKSDGRGAIDGH